MLRVNELTLEQIELAEIFATWGERVADQGGEDLLQLQEQTLSGNVGIGVHGKVKVEG